FNFLLTPIEHHPIFYNDSNHPQSPVELQLAALVTLYCLGYFWNAASIPVVAHTAGCCGGSVKLFTECCFTAIESLHDIFVQKLTPEEK
ncbi:hypothetical protein K435DRAFT_606880, partial [Dendrothele bispora CBS 962.96]